SAHGAFFLDLREEEPADDGREVADPLEHRGAGSGSPTFHDNVTALRVHRGDHALARQGGTEVRARRCADHDLRGARVEPRARCVQIADAAAHARSEEHTSELQSPYDLVCRLLLEKKK